MATFDTNNMATFDIFENTIKVANTSFSDNQCEKCSGGGASIVWQTSRKQ